MAPKGMKRPASGAVESAKKRVKTVVAGLEVADGDFPAAMLISMLEFSLGEFKDKRSAMQSDAVDMIGEALMSAEKKLEAKVADAQEKCDGARAEKDLRVKAETTAREALDGLKVALEATIVEEKKATAEDDTAAAALKAAEAEQKSGDKQYKATMAKKEKVEAAQAEVYTPLKEQVLKDAEIKKMLKQLVSVGKEFSFDPSLLESAPAALSKKPEERGEFDKTILTHFDTQFQKCLEGLSSEIQALEPGKQERESKVSEAKASCDVTQAKKDAAKSAVKDARDVLKTGEKTFKTAELSVKNWLPDIKVMFDVLEKTTAELDGFRTGPLQTYMQLKDTDTPPPPEEEKTEEPEPAAAQEEPKPVAAAGQEAEPVTATDASAVDAGVA